MKMVFVLFRVFYMGLAVYFACNGYMALAIIALIISAISEPRYSDKNGQFIKIHDRYGVDHYINARYIIKMRRYDGKEAKIFSIRDDEYTIGEKEWNEVRKTFKIKEPFKEWKK